jgi:hypothetical protein
MHYKDWERIYKKIAEDFKYPLEKEVRSGKILNSLIKNDKSAVINQLKDLINDKQVVVFGAGLSLDISLEKHKGFLYDKTKIVADGATSALLKCGIQPDIIVSDLDGKISDQIKANRGGSVAVLHAHGDNMEKIKRYVKKFQNNVIGTVQIDPNTFENLYNFGGFTDGDRAIFLADHFQAKTITLIGFDLNSKIGKYSCIKYKDISQKLKKLKWCRELIELLKENNENINYLNYKDSVSYK